MVSFNQFWENIKGALFEPGGEDRRVKKWGELIKKERMSPVEASGEESGSPSLRQAFRDVVRPMVK